MIKMIQNATEPVAFGAKTGAKHVQNITAGVTDSIDELLFPLLLLLFPSLKQLDAQIMS